MQAAIKSLLMLVVGAAGFSIASLSPPQPEFAAPILTGNISYTMHHRTGISRSSYLQANDPNVGEVKFIIGPSKAEKGPETVVAIRPADGQSALEIESNDGAVYADCKSLSLAKADSAVNKSDDPRNALLKQLNIPWWVVRTKTAAAGADGTDLIMQRFFNGSVTDPTKEVTRILFLGPADSKVRTAKWVNGAWVAGYELTIVNTYTELKYVAGAWTFTTPAPIDDGNANVDTDVEKLFTRMNSLVTRAVSPALDDPTIQP